MKTTEIKILPDQFDFKSKMQNNILYHAQKVANGKYVITCNINNYNWDYEEKDLKKYIANGNFVIIEELNAMELAEKLYEMCEDMEYQDYLETKDEDINILAMEIESLQKDSYILKALEIITKKER